MNGSPCGGGRLYGDDGRLWLRGLGQRLVLPALCLVWGLLSGLLSVLSHLRILGVGTTPGPAHTAAVPAGTGPHGGMGASARYNPRTGTYSRSAVAWGPYGARGVGEVQPAHGHICRMSQGSGVYGSWGTTSVQRGDQWAQTARVTNRVTGNTTRVTGSGGGEAITRRGPGGRPGSREPAAVMFMPVATAASIDGRRAADGRNTIMDPGARPSVQRPPEIALRQPAIARPQLEIVPRRRETAAAARGRSYSWTAIEPTHSNGTTRTRDYGNVERSGGGSRSGSGGTYRPRGGGGGGGFRGGGRRR